MKSKFGYILMILGLLFYVNNKLDLRRRNYLENNKIYYTLAKEVNYVDYSNTYDLVLSIPALNLKKGIYRYEIIYDDSGFVFNIDSNLRKLNTDSLINLYYNHIKYTYKLDTIYDLIDDDIRIYKDSNKESIVLINDGVVYIGYLIDEIKY